MYLETDTEHFFNIFLQHAYIEFFSYKNLYFFNVLNGVKSGQNKRVTYAQNSPRAEVKSYG